MKIRIFTIPIYHAGQAESELNSFLGGKRIISLEKRFVDNGAESAWSFCITWTEMSEKAPLQKGKVDYKEVLNEQDFKVYAALRERRKKLAEEEGLPAYAIFTNEQLAEMVKQRVSSKAQLHEIKGIGAARVDKYGEQFLEILARANEELPEPPDEEPI